MASAFVGQSTQYVSKSDCLHSMHQDFAIPSTLGPFRACGHPIRVALARGGAKFLFAVSPPRLARMAGFSKFAIDASTLAGYYGLWKTLDEARVALLRYNALPGNCREHATGRTTVFVDAYSYLFFATVSLLSAGASDHETTMMTETLFDDIASLLFSLIENRGWTFIIVMDGKGKLGKIARTGVKGKNRDRYTKDELAKLESTMATYREQIAATFTRRLPVWQPQLTKTGSTMEIYTAVGDADATIAVMAKRNGYANSVIVSKDSDLALSGGTAPLQFFLLHACLQL